MTAWVVRGSGQPPQGLVIIDWDGLTGVLLTRSVRAPRLPKGWEYLSDAHQSPISARLELLANRTQGEDDLSV